MINILVKNKNIKSESANLFLEAKQSAKYTGLCHRGKLLIIALTVPLYTIYRLLIILFRTKIGGNGFRVNDWKRHPFWL